MRVRGAILPVLAVLASGPAVSAADAVKTFPVSKCRYTLPGKGWSWVEPVPDASYVCVACHEDGLGFGLLVASAPTGARIDAKAAAHFDKGAYATGGVRKRGGRITTFKGLPCYESEWVHDDQQTVAVRVIVANGYLYQLQLRGNADPVEKRPDFEAIMDGFEFTSPPVPPAAPESRSPWLPTAGGFVKHTAIAFTVMLILALLNRIDRKKRPAP
jgi:hypothetical protein